MAIDAACLGRAAQRAAAAMREAEQGLNEADARLGDGDTGVTMRRVFERIAEAVKDGPSDVGSFFQKAGAAAAGATGSSLGTLCAVALIETAKTMRGREHVPAEELAGLLRSAQKVMLARGGAALGDKTVLDSLAAVAAAIDSVDAVEMSGRALAAAHDVLEAFRDKPCRVGRARMFSERSIGIDDPGMLAFTRLVEAVACAAPAPVTSSGALDA